VRWGRERSREGVVGLKKGVEESISLGVDFDPAVIGKGRAHESAVLGEDSPRFSSKRVEPSMSVNTRVTVPRGSSAMSPRDAEYS
jgi:hypothetical protein